MTDSIGSSSARDLPFSSEAGPKDPQLSVFIGVSGANIVGQFGIVFAPFLIPFATKHLAIDSLSASRLISIELFALLVTSLVASSVRSFAPRAASVAGCLLYAIGSFAAAASQDTGVFAAARASCGIGCGLALVSVNRAAASHHAYKKLVTIAVIVIVAVATAALIVVPAVFELYGAPAAYASLGGLALLCSTASVGLSRGDRKPTEGRATDLGAGPWILLGAFFLSRLSDASILPFVEFFGSRVGFGASAVGLVLAVTTLLAIIGPLIAMRADSRDALFRLFVATLAVKSGATALMFFVPTQQAYVVAQTLTSCTVVLAGQLFLTRFAFFDFSGRLGGFASTSGLAADAIGLTLAAQVFAAASFGGTTLLTAGIGVGSVLLCCVAFLSDPRPPAKAKTT